MIYFIFQSCTSEISGSVSGDYVEWPPTNHGRESYSIPRCVSLNKHFIKRTCVYQCWLPQEAWPCQEVQDVYNYHEHCTKTSFYFNGHCIEISYTSWEERCRSLGNDESILQKSEEWLSVLFEYLLSEKYDRIWLPAKQLEYYGPYVWFLLGRMWKTPVYLEIKNRNLGSCLSLQIVNQHKFVLEAVDCSIKLPTVCLNDIKLQKSNCPNGYYTTSIPDWQHTCYGFEKITSSMWQNVYKNKRMMINNADVNYVYQHIMNIASNFDKCWIGLEHVNDTFIWTTGMPVTFLNWNITENYIYNYGLIESNGFWSLWSPTAELNCFAYYVENTIQEPEIVLKFYPNLELLELSIYAPESLYVVDGIGVHCFAGSSLISYKKVEIGDLIWDSNWSGDYFIVKRKVLYEVMLEDYPDTYWCEGFTLNSGQLISTNQIYAYKKFYPHMYSLLWEMPTEMLNGIAEDKDFLLELFPNIHVKDYRVQKILEVTKYKVTTIIQMILNGDITIKTSDADIIHSYEIAQEIVREINKHPDVNIQGMNNTLYCIPDQYIFSSYKGIQWPVTKLDHRATTSELCLQENGLPIYRCCVGDVIFGSIWKEPTGFCNSSIAPSSTTSGLFDINAKHGELINCTDCITDEIFKIIFNAESIIPADIYYLGLILEKVALKSHKDKIFNKRKIVTDIISKIAEINSTSIALSQIALNSTNIITDSINRLLEVIPIQDDFLNDKDDGVILIRSSEFICQISNPSIKNVSGIALIKKNASSIGNLDDYDLMTISSHQTLDKLMQIENLELLTWVPDKLLERINDTTYNKTGCNISIIITIYNSDVYFKEQRTNFFADKVVSVSIPHYGPNLPIPLTILFRQNFENFISPVTNVSCNYWNYQPKFDMHNNFGEWYNDGCFRTMEHESGKYNLTVCECSHLTNFAQLVTGNTKLTPNTEETQHEKNLNMITMIGCTLSIIGLTGIFIMAIVYKSWRKKTGIKVLLHLSSAIFIEMVVILIMNVGIVNISEVDIESPGYSLQETCCVVLGSILHYIVLACFCWMVIIAYMQYLRYVRVLGIIRPAKFMQKAAAIAWGCPFAPVLLLLAIDNGNYIPQIESENAICYPSGIALFITVVGPIAVMILINMIFYTSVLIAIFHRPKNVIKKNHYPSLISAQLRLSIFLFFLLGLTWSFALAAALDAGIVFSYLFCLTATLQGFILFIYFVIVDPATRNLWKCCGKPDTVDSNTF